MPLTYRDRHSASASFRSFRLFQRFAGFMWVRCKFKGGCLIACIVIIVLHYISAKDDNRFGRASMAMDGEDGARFYGIEDALALVFRCCPKIKGMA